MEAISPIGRQNMGMHLRRVGGVGGSRGASGLPEVQQLWPLLGLQPKAPQQKCYHPNPFLGRGSKGPTEITKRGACKGTLAGEGPAS